jgi:hypothetical protein
MTTKRQLKRMIDGVCAETGMSRRQVLALLADEGLAGEPPDVATAGSPAPVNPLIRQSKRS